MGMGGEADMNDDKGSLTEQRREFLIKFMYWGVIALCVYGVGKYLLPVLFPFVLAFGIAYVLDRPARFLAGGSGWKRTAVSILLSAAFFIVVGGLAVWCGLWVFSGISQVVAALPGIFQESVFPLLEEGILWVEKWFRMADPATLELVNGSLESVLGALSNGIVALSNIILSAVAGLAAGVPAVFMNMVITVIATVFLTIDFEKIKELLRRLIPERHKDVLCEARRYFGGTLLKCMASYGLIFCITFLELWIGLALIGIPGAMMIALVIAALDILPVLGTGSVLIPWGVIAAVNGSFGTAAGVIVLYLVITVIRNVIEPKLVGKQVGLHPVLTLMGMLLGLKFGGLVGMLGIPLLMAFVMQLKDKGMISFG